jgi:C4-dicarboxylate transporter DctQ subunit
MRHLTNALAWLNGFVILLLTAAVGYGVIMRFALNAPVTWTDELAGYLLVAMVMLGAGDATRRGAHIEVDLLTSYLGARAKMVVRAVSLLAIAVFGAFMAYGAWGMLSFSYMVGLLSTGYMALPLWIPQSLMLVGMAVMTLTAIAGLGALWKAPSPPDAASGIRREGSE